MLAGEVTMEGVFGCPVAVKALLMVENQVSADDFSLCVFVRSLQSPQSASQSSLIELKTMVMPSFMLTKVSVSVEGVESVVFPNILGIEGFHLGSSCCWSGGAW